MQSIQSLDCKRFYVFARLKHQWGLLVVRASQEKLFKRPSFGGSTLAVLLRRSVASNGFTCSKQQVLVVAVMDHPSERMLQQMYAYV